MYKIIKNKIRGSLTVEATLVLPMVIVTLLFLANILNICMVNLCMQQSLNNTAKKISQDSYLVYRVSGERNFVKFIDNLNDVDQSYETVEAAAKDTKSKFDNVQKNIKQTIDNTNIVLSSNAFNGTYTYISLLSSSSILSLTFGLNSLLLGSINEVPFLPINGLILNTLVILICLLIIECSILFVFKKEKGFS